MTDVRGAPAMLRVAHRAAPIEAALGPGRRAVIWVQGCASRCAGCIAPEAWDPAAGALEPVDQVAGWLLARPDIEGVTLSGGEPMLQAAGLAALIRHVRRRRDLGVICYTGFVMPPPDSPHGVPLDLDGPAADLLARVDLLIDGPYVESLHADLLWRGSGNQRLIALTDRYRDLLPAVGSRDDSGAGLVCSVDAEGGPHLAGVPSEAGFRRRFEALLADRGVDLKPVRGG